MTSVSFSDHKIRITTLVEIRSLNSSIKRIFDSFPEQMSRFASSLPTLDNNIYVGYPQIQRLLVARKNGENSVYTAPTLERLKRSRLGNMLELVWSLLSPRLRTRARLGTAKYEGDGRVIVFTYSDYDDVITTGAGSSKYWGMLPDWLSRENVSWVGIGKKSIENEKIPSMGKFLQTYLESLADLLISLPTRLKIWKLMRAELCDNPLFMILGSEFRRSLFGAPALEAEFLRRDFIKFLDESHARIVLTPYENQLWERVLSRECRLRGIVSAGAYHTTPKFWDLRFFDMAAFRNFQPDFVISNGALSSSLLALSGLSKSQVVEGTALRFDYLKNSQKADWKDRKVVNGRRTLVILGTNLETATELVKLVRSITALKDGGLFFRPHASTLGWFTKKHAKQVTDQRDIEFLLGDYDTFITESMASMALELAVNEANVFVYAPKHELNFSPLASVPSFERFFHDEASFTALLDTPKVKFELSEVLDVTDSESKWKKIIERLLIHGSQEK